LVSSFVLGNATFSSKYLLHDFKLYDAYLRSHSASRAVWALKSRTNHKILRSLPGCFFHQAVRKRDWIESKSTSSSAAAAMPSLHDDNNDDDADNVPARIVSGPNYKDQMRDVVVADTAAGITMTESTTATTGEGRAAAIVDHRYAGKPSFLMPAAAAADMPCRGPGFKDQMQEAPEVLEAAAEMAARDGAASFLFHDYNDKDKKRPATATAAAARVGRGPYLPVAVPIGESIIVEEKQEERLQLAELAAREAQRQKREAEEKLQKSKKLKLRMAFIMLIILLLVGIAVAAVCGSGQCQAIDDDPITALLRPTTSPVPVTPTPTRSPTPLTAENRAKVDYLRSVTLLTGRNLTYPDRDTPEGLAILWIIEEDEVITTTWTDELKLLALRQRYVLATLWSQGTNVEKHLFGRWNSQVSECKWSNVKCDAATERIIESIDLTGLGVQGHIPDDLGLLTGLTYLDFSNNQMEGTIPTSLLRLTKLTDLRLYNNQFISGTTSLPFCENNGINQTSPFHFTNLVTDCDQLDCPCCTYCCGVDNDSQRAIPANWSVQCVA
jgi:hypothetical protein